MNSPQTLSREAIEEFRNIYEEEFGERLSEEEVRSMALRLLRLFGMLVSPSPEEGGTFDAEKSVR